MGSRRKAIMAALMLTMLIGQTVAVPLILPVVVGGIIGAGAIGYWLGLKSQEKTIEELKAEIDKLKSSNTLVEDANLRFWLQRDYTLRSNIILLGQDLLQYSRNYAWALAKYNALKVLDYELTQNGTNFTYAKTLAKQKAHEAVYNYYLNLTRNIIAMHNETVGLLNYSLNYYMNSVGVYTITFDVPDYLYATSTSGSYYIKGAKFDNSTGTLTAIYDFYYSVTADRLKESTTTLSALGRTFTTKDLVVDFTYNSNTVTLQVQTIDIDQRAYNWTLYSDIINQIDSEYNMINANIDAYIDGLAQDYVNQWNITQLIDPYIVAGILNHDFNATGYMGYAAAELAMLGLNTTGINKTVTIRVYEGNNTTVLVGWLFTDWVGTLVPGMNYTADPNYKWFFVDDNGLYDITGYNFTFVKATDWKGNPLQNVTLVRYVSHTGDAAKMYEELAKIRQLYEEYVKYLQNMAAAGGSGSGFSLSEWWNSLDNLAKVGVIAIGAVGIYAVLRRK